MSARVFLTGNRAGTVSYYTQNREKKGEKPGECFHSSRSAGAWSPWVCRMNISTVFLVLLTRALMAEVTEALNVTIIPGPIATAPQGENTTLSCMVSQRKMPTSLLVVRWLFSLEAGQEQLIVRLNVRRAEYYGNYTRRFAHPKVKFFQEKEGETYNLLILNISKEDRGHYTCKVQEIRKYRNRWRASSNGTATTELRVHVLPVAESRDGVWRLFQDVYLCAVLICSTGLLCMFLFTVILACQYLQRKRRLKANYCLVKCPQNSSGETVTSILSSSPGMAKKDKKHKQKYIQAAETPPEIPAKAPIEDKLRKPKLLKAQTKKQPKIAEENLTYAELELVKPQPETKSTSTGTVYAQILFQEKHLRSATDRRLRCVNFLVHHFSTITRNVLCL
ncbi:V-set and transmembrane domain-containing protein 4a isoform X2 [Scleropages formosus]|uniref:V-set and transmembrane domain containing 4a n=1 Tax=Scleropages formosus TaxID=113540 RepID=A0A8C9V6A8_SCLFO|nr:V-set and transmembrane domain-containing protein 4 isoform X2 [Scleropages formosus]